MNVTLDYEPSEPQRMFHQSTAKEVLYGGAAGGGKSHALRWEGLIRSLQIPGHKAIIFRKNFPDLEKSQIRASKEEFPTEVCHYVGNKRRWEFDNGSIIDFGHLDNADDIYKYKSAEYEYIGFDELTDFSEDQYLYLFSRLRTSKQGIIPIMRSATNPEGRGLAWVKKRFVDPAPPYEVWKPKNGGTRQFIPATIHDNSHVNKEDYIENLMALPEDRRRALLEGDWNQFQGQVFKEFNPEIHVIKPLKKIPVSYPKYMSIDWGFTAPFNVLWAFVDEGNNVYIFREWYGCPPGETNKGLEMPARQVAREIGNIEDSNEEVINVRVCDPSMSAHRGHDGPSIMETFTEEGIYMMRGDNDRLAGKQQVHDRLRLEDGKPSLYIYETCYHLIRTLPALSYNPRRPEDVETDGDDHPYDSLRYLLMARPYKPPKRKKKRKLPKRNPYTGY